MTLLRHLLNKRENSVSMNSEQLKDAAVAALEDIKAKEIDVLDVRELSGVTDYMIVCSGTSSRHVKSLADNVEVELKKQGIRALGAEGIKDAEWALVDFGDVVVHVMLPEVRAFYDLEKLWRVTSSAKDQ